VPLFFAASWEHCPLSQTVVGDGPGKATLACRAAEFVDHDSLASLLEADGKTLDLATKPDLCLDVANGISALHGCRAIHGDVMLSA